MKKPVAYVKWSGTLLLLFILVTVTAQDQPGRVEPDYSHIPYSNEKPYNILNIYIAENTKYAAPTPVYIWSHGGGGTLDSFDQGLWNLLSPAGISAVSWGSVNLERTAEYGIESRHDFEKVMEFILKNADKYNFDVKKIVVGGTSRGSFITWEYSHKNPDIVKGIYSTGALGDPAMWREKTRFLTSRDPREDLHTGSPPLLFAYPDLLGDVNVHSPRSGVLIKERYVELGIGHKARVEHSLSKRNLSRWAFIVDFIREIANE